MIIAALLIVELAQIGVLIFILKQHETEKNKLINALIAEKPDDVINLTMADKAQPEKPFFDDRPSHDLVSERDLSDEDFDKYVVKGGQNGQ